MSYIQIEIGGKLRGLKFNNYGLEKIVEKMDGGSASAFVYAMIWGGLKGNSYAKAEEPDYTFENVIDWLDVLPDKIQIIESVTKIMTETQNYKDLIKPQEPVNETPEEKKSAIENHLMPT